MSQGVTGEVRRLPFPIHPGFIRLGGYDNGRLKTPTDVSSRS